MFKYPLLIWLSWVWFNLVMIGFVSFVFKPNMPCFTGLVIVMPKWLDAILTGEEYLAVLEHEIGHLRHRHVWKNFVRRCFFVVTTAEQRAEQEREADRYVFAKWPGASAALASARRKIVAEQRKQVLAGLKGGS